MGRPTAEIGVFGGSGFYALLDHPRDVPVSTPYGPPSAPVTVGDFAGRTVAFLPRHGVGHEYPPHRVNYRANVWALRELGVTRVFGPCAVGSLQPDIHPGDFVVLDQLIDRTWGRPETFADGPVVHHVSFADPYCAELRGVIAGAARAEGVTVHDTGTVVVVQGPRFSTRAESRIYRDAGAHVINMTQHPEAYLARELGLCYAGLALVTDYDTGVDGEPGVEPVSMDRVFAVLRANVERTRAVLARAIPTVAGVRSCTCADSAIP